LKFWKIKSLRILFCSTIFRSIKKFFPSVFFVFSFLNTLISHMLELLIQNLSFRILYCEKICLWSFYIIKSCLWSFGSPSCKLFLCFVLGLVSISCVEVCKREGIVYSWCWVIISQWRSLCGRLCVDIVKIFLCKGRDVEQWLEPRNICYVCVWSSSLNSQLLYFTLIYLLILICLILFVYPHLCLIKRAIETPQLIIQRNSE